jgi:hypothetical protein
MRKWRLLIILLLAVAAACLYLVIPGKEMISAKNGVAVNAKAFSRAILEEEKWKQWWPGEILHTQYNRFGKYRFNGVIYSILGKKLSSVVILVEHGKDTLTTELVFLPVKSDSIALSWEGTLQSSLSPVRRMQQFFITKRMERDISTLLERIREFYSDESNIYGLKIIKDHVADSTLISTAGTTKGYPSVERIYKMVDQLKDFAHNKGAKQTGLPMLNIMTTDSVSYLTKVALPVDKKLKDEGKIVYRWMLGGGNILVTEVKGGPYTIQKSFETMEKYTEDHQRLAPAIPFQSLVTDRSQEPDTSKWITKIYWPVM